MKGEISQPSKALELWRRELSSSKFSVLNSYFSLPISLYLLEPPFCLEDHGCIYRRRSVKGLMRGGRGWFFALYQLPHVHANHALSPFAKKKTKKSSESGLGT